MDEDHLHLMIFCNIFETNSKCVINYSFILLMTFIKYPFATCAYAGRCVEYDNKINTDPALKELRVGNDSFSYLHATSSKHLPDHFLNKTRAKLGSYVGVECQIGRMATLLPKAQGAIP